MICWPTPLLPLPGCFLLTRQGVVTKRFERWLFGGLAAMFVVVLCFSQAHLPPLPAPQSPGEDAALLKYRSPRVAAEPVRSEGKEGMSAQPALNPVAEDYNEAAAAAAGAGVGAPVDGSGSGGDEDAPLSSSHGSPGPTTSDADRRSRVKQRFNEAVSHFTVKRKGPSLAVGMSTPHPGSAVGVKTVQVAFQVGWWQGARYTRPTCPYASTISAVVVCGVVFWWGWDRGSLG